MELEEDKTVVVEKSNEVKNPLVSIIVIAYNSSKYVLETLESAKTQTYKNIELIITDDCSTDNTIEICRDWVKNNYSRFVNVEIIKAKENKGIAPNCNQGLFKAKGEWVKFIAGDDLLMDNCLETNLKFSQESKHSFFFSKMKYTQESKNLEGLFTKGCELFRTEENQLKILIKNNYLAAPSNFIRTKALLKLNGFDERFPMVEDYPMWIKVVKNNYKIIVNDCETVIYRINDESVSQTKKLVDEKRFYTNVKFKMSFNKFIGSVLIKEQLVNSLPIRAFESLITLLQIKIVIIFNNKKNIISILMFNVLSVCKPSFYYNLFSKIKNEVT